jgi:5-deoxy-D-glucuronate isomerase
LKRIYSSDQTSQVLLDITPEIAGWKYISFRVVRLAEGKTLEADTASNEAVIVPLGGRGRLSFDGNTEALIRNDLFRELADIVYLPYGLGIVREALAGRRWSTACRWFDTGMPVVGSLVTTVASQNSGAPCRTVSNARGRGTPMSSRYLLQTDDTYLWAAAGVSITVILVVLAL